MIWRVHAVWRNSGSSPRLFWTMLALMPTSDIICRPWRTTLIKAMRPKASGNSRRVRMRFDPRRRTCWVPKPMIVHAEPRMARALSPSPAKTGPRRSPTPRGSDPAIRSNRPGRGSGPGPGALPLELALKLPGELPAKLPGPLPGAGAGGMWCVSVPAKIIQAGGTGQAFTLAAVVPGVACSQPPGSASRRTGGEGVGSRGCCVGTAG